jgi:hypothetical protein
MSNNIIRTLICLLIIFSIHSISTAQNDQVEEKDSTTQESISTEAVKDSTSKTTTENEPVKDITVPAGTKFKVNINMALSNSKNVTGSSFSAILEADFVYDETVISPKGSQVIGKIVESKGGKGVGDAKLSFQFTEITVNDQLTPIVTDPIEVKGGRGRKAQAEIAAGTIKEVTLKNALIIK